MASQFINNNNQTMLWKIINNTPQMVQVFHGSAPGKKEKWFGQVIKHVYDELIASNKQMSLRDINKYAIDFMLSLLNEQLNPQPQVQPPQPPKNSNNTVLSQFEMRRQEYESMINKEQPKPNFTETIKDEPITDINLSLDEYRKQRDRDINQIMKSMPLSPQQINANPVSLTISESTEQIQLPIEVIDNIPKKQVKWGTNTEHEYIDYTSKLETKVDKIIQLLQTMTIRMDSLELHYQNLYKTQSDNNNNMQQHE